MKVSVRMAVLSASILGLAACASTSEPTSYAPAHQAKPTVMKTDDDYVSRVEAIARRRGIGVTWVNPPRKIVAKSED